MLTMNGSLPGDYFSELHLSVCKSDLEPVTLILHSNANICLGKNILYSDLARYRPWDLTFNSITYNSQLCGFCQN